MPKLFATGSDPEYFIVSGAGQPVAPKAAHIPGNKRAPVALTCGGKIHRDNACLELNIVPARTGEELVANMREARQEAEIMYLAPMNNMLSDWQFMYIPDQWKKYKEIMILGCDPSLDCWDYESPMQYDPFDPFRSAGGHVHISYENPSMLMSQRIACILDIKLGLRYSTLMERDNPRRHGYGRSGQMRFTPYGLEYRPLSNKWTFSDDAIVDVHNTCVNVVENVEAYWSTLLAEYSVPEVKRIFYDGSEAEVTACLSKFS